MSQNPKTFLRFLHEQFDLLEALCRQTTHSLGDLEELIEVHGKNRGLTPEGLVESGILEHDEASMRYAVTAYLKAFLDRLLRRRSLVDAKLVEGAVQMLALLRGQLEDSVRVRSFARVTDLVYNVRSEVLRLNEAIESNVEAIHRFTSEYRKTPPRSSRERLGRVREIWEHYVQPMQALFEPDGALDEAAMGLRRALEHAEDRAPLEVIDDLQWARHDLRKLSINAFRSYMDVAHEVAPLYEQAKRHAQVAMSASALITCYHRAAQGLGRTPEEALWDRWFGLMDPWEEIRSLKAFGSGAIASWLAQAHYKRPNPAPLRVLASRHPFRAPLTAKVVMHRFVATGAGSQDLLAWIAAEFPEAGLREVIRAYHLLLKETEVTRGGERRVISLPEADLTSQPVAGVLDGAS